MSSPSSGTAEDADRSIICGRIETSWGMSTTTVTGTGRRASMIQTKCWPPPTKTPSPQSISSPLDKFPTFVDESHGVATTESEASYVASPARYGPNDLSQPRKPGRISWDQVNGSGGSKHRPRKSISEAITTIRARNASMSANAQELAAALKAPVSYKLIVGLILTVSACCPSLMLSLGTLPNLVHDLGPYEYLIQIHLECVTTTHHSHDHPIHIRATLVFIACLCFEPIPRSQKDSSGT